MTGLDLRNESGRLHLWVMLLCLVLIFPGPAMAQPADPPWIENIGAASVRSDIHTISADADVQVSDGLRYQVNTIYQGPQQAVFRRVYADRTIAQGVEDGYIWAYDGHLETEVGAFIGEVVMGHQFHAQILFFDRLHDVKSEPTSAYFAQNKCLRLSSAGEIAPLHFYFDDQDRPLGMEKVRENMANIIFKFEDWRDVSGIALPFRVLIDDGERQFHYRYSQIRLNAGSTVDFRAPESVLTKEQKQRRKK